MIYITGDTHGGHSIKKLNMKCFPEQKDLSKSDYVIVLGDFGFIWDGKKHENWWLEWLNQRQFTTLFIDGNHENFNLLNQYPVEEWNGGQIHRINESVIHLMRGQVFEINGIKIFTFGGASSVDKELRKEGISWWIQEMPTNIEYQEGIVNLEKIEWEVDFVLTHTCPHSVLLKMEDIFNEAYNADEVIRYLDTIQRNLKYRHWYYAHFHRDMQLDERHTVVYEKIIKVL